MDRKEIILLTDYRNSFYSHLGSQEDGFDLSRVGSLFAGEGFRVSVKQFTDVDFLNDDVKDVPVLFTSLEDPELYYKSFIEDVILGLFLKGAFLIPRFECLRAHHNKVFMEILRAARKIPGSEKIRSSVYGVIREAEIVAETFSYPKVIKSAAGSGSKSVMLAGSPQELISGLQKITRAPKPLAVLVKHALRPLVRKVKKLLNPKVRFDTLQTYCEKFIIQDFVPNLSHDYKVLVYNKKFYVLRRGNRANDFRASGSGLFSWVTDAPAALLAFAESIYTAFDVPYISLDLAFAENECYLIEFQFLHFGTLTLEGSTFYFTRDNDLWIRVEESPDLEREFVSSVSCYLKRNGY